jgi:hypothetical protein
MCIIVAIPQGKQICKSTLRTCWENNPHGGGFMYSDGNKVSVFKEMLSFKKYWKAFHDAKQKNLSSAFVCHFRISTHGKINETNCHPFLVNKNLGFVHNGIIYSAPKSDNFSDTYMFNEAILKHLPNNFLTNPAHVSLIENYIGSGSKLAFLNTKSDITIINEKAGVWDDGVWYSNAGYKATKYFDYGGTKVGSIGQPVWGKQYVTQSLFPENKTTKVQSPKKVYECCDDEITYRDVYSTDADVDIWGNTRNTPLCDYCGDGLATSVERLNNCCTTCHNSILDADARDWRGYKK